jgi:hypothetical protein
MDIMKFDDYAELGEYLIDTTDDYELVSVVLFKDDIVNLLRWLMEYDNIDLGHIDIKDEFIDDYEKEYYLTIDSDLSISIEPVYDEDGDIVPCYSDIVLFDGDTSSKIVFANEDCEKIEISIAEEDDEDNCGDCCYDCGSCPKMASQAISSALSMIDYILNHLDD